MIISLLRITNTIHAGALPKGIIIMRAAATISLSATGSRNLPKIVTIPIRLAIYPSSQSVMEARANTKVAMKLEVLEGDSNRTTSTGIMTIRKNVRKLGRL
jgi:hypothetical protein